MSSDERTLGFALEHERSPSLKEHHAPTVILCRQFSGVAAAVIAAWFEASVLEGGSAAIYRGVEHGPAEEHVGPLLTHAQAATPLLLSLVESRTRRDVTGCCQGFPLTPWLLRQATLLCSRVKKRGGE